MFERSPGWMSAVPPSSPAGRESPREQQGPGLRLHGSSPCGHTGYSCQSSSCVWGQSVLWASWTCQGEPRGPSSRWGLPCGPRPRPGLPHPSPAIRPMLWPLPEAAPVGSPSLPGHVLGPLCGAHWPVRRGQPGPSYVQGSRCRGWTGWYPHSEPGTQPRQMDIPGRAHGQWDAVVPARGPICPSPQRERNRAASRRGSGQHSLSAFP